MRPLRFVWLLLSIHALAFVHVGAAGAQDSPSDAEDGGPNHDFVRGEHVLASVDFGDQPVARFPASELTHVRGNAQIVEHEDEKWLESSSTSVVRLELPEETGDAYTVEFRARIPTANLGVNLFFAPLEGSRRRHPHDVVHLSSDPGVHREGQELAVVHLPDVVGRIVPVRLQVDRGYGILYVGTERVAQVPDGRFPSTRVLEFHLAGNKRFQVLLSDIVVATGLDDLYDALVSEGEFTTRGILFDVDSDRLRPESTRVLTELADVLDREDHLRVTIEGHTDGQGDEAYNQQLSERRAAAVVSWLVDRGIAPDRLSAAGKGESEPVASNDTAEGRQENRRVVVVVAD